MTVKETNGRVDHWVVVTTTSHGLDLATIQTNDANHDYIDIVYHPDAGHRYHPIDLNIYRITAQDKLVEVAADASMDNGKPRPDALSRPLVVVPHASIPTTMAVSQPLTFLPQAKKHPGKIEDRYFKDGYAFAYDVNGVERERLQVQDCFGLHSFDLSAADRQNPVVKDTLLAYELTARDLANDEISYSTSLRTLVTNSLAAFSAYAFLHIVGVLAFSTLAGFTIGAGLVIGAAALITFGIQQRNWQKIENSHTTLVRLYYRMKQALHKPGPVRPWGNNPDPNVPQLGAQVSQLSSISIQP